MMYYNNGRYFYNDPPRKVEAKPIEYAFREEVQGLRKDFEIVDNTVRFLLDKEVEHRNDLDQMYQAIDGLKEDAQQARQAVNYLYHKIESAPSVAKRRRKVTICANGQRVDIKRV